MRLDTSGTAPHAIYLSTHVPNNVASPFNNFELLESWPIQVSLNVHQQQKVLLLGSVPFDEGDFEKIIVEKGIVEENQITYNHNEYAIILVIGEDWEHEENNLKSFISVCRGKRLYVCSQQMFLYWFITGNNPFEMEGSEAILDAFSSDHTGLQYLKQGNIGFGFDWPSANVILGDTGVHDVGQESWPKIGMMKHMGYSVGQSSRLSESQRQSILRIVYMSANLPQVKDAAYVREFGDPNTAKRLQKIANFLSSMAKQQKRKATPSDISIARWEADLAWLHDTFYRGHYRFSWPDTFVE